MTSRTISAPMVAVLSVALMATMLAGCASRSLREPPQVVERSTGGSARTAPAPSSTTNPIDPTPVAVPTPIGNETVEQRPLGTTPIPPSSSASPGPGGPATSKSEPLGAKRPYSDAAMADLARTDGNAPSPTPAAAAPATPAAAPTILWGWPATGKVTTAFGGKSNGIDIVGNTGDPVVAAADGKVTFAGTGVRGYGTFVIVRHSPELLSVYANNRTVLVKEGATITRGQKIAEMGMSDATSPRLHFEIRSDSRPIDPLKYLPAR